MTWEDVPPVLYFETDGNIWAKVEVNVAERSALAYTCTRQKQSLQTIIIRALRRKIRGATGQILDQRPCHGGFPEAFPV